MQSRTCLVCLHSHSHFTWSFLVRSRSDPEMWITPGWLASPSPLLPDTLCPSHPSFPPHLPSSCFCCCMSTSAFNLYGIPSAGFTYTASFWVFLPACAQRWLEVPSPHLLASHHISGPSFAFHPFFFQMNAIKLMLKLLVKHKTASECTWSTREKLGNLCRKSLATQHALWNTWE